MRCFSPPPAPHQWRSGSPLKAGRREMPDSIPGRSYQPSCSKFSVVLSETRLNTGKNSSERLSTEGTPPTGPGIHKRTVGLNPTINQPIAFDLYILIGLI